MRKPGAMKGSIPPAFARLFSTSELQLGTTSCVSALFCSQLAQARPLAALSPCRTSAWEAQEGQLTHTQVAAEDIQLQTRQQRTWAGARRRC